MSQQPESAGDAPDWATIDFLDREVFDEWRSQVTAVLQSHGLYQIATGEEREPVCQPLALNDFKLRARRAREIILSSMGESGLKRQLREIIDPAKIWQDLREASDESNRLTELLRQFYNLRPFEGESYLDYFRRLDVNRQPLEGTSRRILDDDLFDHFVDTTPSNPYHNWAYMNYAESNRTLAYPPLWN